MGRSMWIVCITSVRHVLTVNGYGGRQTKENEKSWCFKGWETLVNNYICSMHFYLTTYKHQSKYTIEEIVELIKKKHGSDAQIIFYCTLLYEKL